MCAASARSPPPPFGGLQCKAHILAHIHATWCLVHTTYAHVYLPLLYMYVQIHYRAQCELLPRTAHSPVMPHCVRCVAHVMVCMCVSLSVMCSRVRRYTHTIYRTTEMMVRGARALVRCMRAQRRISSSWNWISAVCYFSGFRQAELGKLDVEAMGAHARGWQMA